MTGPSSPAVSVVTPVYQGVPYLDTCIESVLGQTFEDWEYVILDNASDDGSWERARDAAAEDPRVRAHRNDRTLPFVENWNRALDLVSPESRYIKVVHADDWIRPECLEAMVGVAERHPDVALVGGWVSRGEEIMCRWRDAPGEAVSGSRVARLSLLGEVPYLFGSPTSVLMRGDAVRSVGRLYPEEDTDVLGQVVDQDACYRLLKIGDFGYVTQVLTATREHDDSITAQNERLGRWYAGKIALHLRHAPEFLEEEEYRTTLEDWLDRYYRFLGKAVWRGRNREFWRYHRDALERLGFGFQRGRVVRAAADRLATRVKRGVGRRLARIRGAASEERDTAGEGS